MLVCMFLSLYILLQICHSFPEKDEFKGLSASPNMMFMCTNFLPQLYTVFYQASFRFYFYVSNKFALYSILLYCTDALLYNKSVDKQ